MFKLESYITPLLMGYLDKYVKLRQEDFQLSLWGGDAVLSNLDLRLDELEKVIQLPVVFQSGHIHELRLHVPWTKLGSEPVIVTINTVECIMKVRDRAYEGSSTSQSSEAAAKAAQQKLKVKRKQEDEDLPPGYLQSIVNRIINNVSFVFNNLILKFVEDDIVLSVNIKSAECYSVDRDWNRAFVDLIPEDLALRKVINFADLTVCLDKTNVSGHIESYQEPMVYRCAVTCRLHMSYDSVTAKFPKATRFNVYCDTLNLCLTDTQLPMFVRLLELLIAMYYGYLDVPSATERTPPSTSVDPQVAKTSVAPGPADGYNPYNPYGDENSPDEGWASWAWSMVPQILPPGEEEDEGGGGGRSRRGRTSPLILSIGFYIHQGNIIFKLTERAKDGSELPHKKMHFHPFLTMAYEGASLEVLLQGLEFCDVQSGMTSCHVYANGNCICGVLDEDVARCNTLLRAGEALSQKMQITYLSNSLFDATSFENQGHTVPYILDKDVHLQTYTEQYGLTKFGAFWNDYLYTFEKPEKHRSGAGSNSSDTDPTDAIFDREFSNLRFLLGDVHVTVSSTFHHRLSKFISCMWDPQYEAYGAGKGISDGSEERPKPTEEQIQSVENFIPTQLVHLALINPTMTVITSEHPECNAAKKTYRTRHRKKDPKKDEPHHSKDLAALVIVASRFDLQVTKPMYPGRLIKLVSAIAGPSSNLLHHCHRHTQIKLFGLHAGIQRTSANGTVSRPITLVSPYSFAVYFRYLVLPKLWTNSSLSLSEWMFEVPNVSVNVNKASIIMVSQIISSWTAPKAAHRGMDGMDDSLLDDLFPVSGESTKQNFPLLEFNLCSLEFKSCTSTLVDACTASLSSVQVVLYTPGVGGKMSVIPILCGPSNTSQMTKVDFFNKKEVVALDVVTSDCVTMTLQKPKNITVREAPALALVDCQGMAVWVDPGLMGWFHYCPQPRPSSRASDQQQAQQTPVSLDLTLAHMTSPLNAVSQASVHSTSSQSRTGASRPRTPSATPRGHRDGRTVHSAPSQHRKDREEKQDNEGQTLGETFATYFPLIRALHLQVDMNSSVLFLPKAGMPTTSESCEDLVTSVQQAFVKGWLSPTLVLCLPSVLVTSVMAKRIHVLQELPTITTDASTGSLIGDRLPWTIRLAHTCVYSLLPGQTGPSFLLHPLDVVSTLAVNSTYSPPTSEHISSLALCIHVDVGTVKTDLTSDQLHLLSVTSSQMSSLANDVSSLSSICLKMFATVPPSTPGGSTTSSPRDVPSVRKSVSSSTHRIRTCSQSLQSGEVTTDQGVTDASEDLSHDASPLHENIVTTEDESGTKLSLWLQLMLPKVDFTIYHPCVQSRKENGVSLTLENLDLCLDSQSVYSKVKLNLSSFHVQHSCKGSDGSWNWSELDGVIVTCTHQLPRNLRIVSNKLWVSDNPTTPMSFGSHQSHDAMGRDKKHGVLAVTMTRALCKNVKKRLKKANVELPSVSEAGCTVDDIGGGSVDYGTSGPTSSTQFDSGFFYFHEYLSEICLKAGPVDVVMKSEAVDVLTSFFSTVARKESSRLPKSNINFPKESAMFEALGNKQMPPNSLPQSSPSSSSPSPTTESFSVQNLPLVYADVGMMRFFLPLHNGHRTPHGQQSQALCDKSSSSSSSLPLPHSSTKPTTTSQETPTTTTTTSSTREGENQIHSQPLIKPGSKSKGLSPDDQSRHLPTTQKDQFAFSKFDAITTTTTTSSTPKLDNKSFVAQTDLPVKSAKHSKVSFSPGLPLSAGVSSASSSTSSSYGGHTTDDSDGGRSKKISTTLDHTMVVVQINNLNISPHADNPLTRTPLETAVYQHALQSGHAHQPGSSVEDRQYQVEIKGLAISTGCWDRVMQEAKHSVTQHSSSGSRVQIPALEWNTFLMDGLGHERKEILLAPLASGFDVTLVVAPPIHCAPKGLDHMDRPTYLICGMTTELNITSDLDLYLSNGQFELLSLLTSQLGQDSDLSKSSNLSSSSSSYSSSPLIATHHPHHPHHHDDILKDSTASNSTNHHHHPHHQQHPQHQQHHILPGMDSGVESDVSTLTIGEQHPQQPQGNHHHHHHQQQQQHQQRHHHSRKTATTPDGKGKKGVMIREAVSRMTDTVDAQNPRRRRSVGLDAVDGKNEGNKGDNMSQASSLVLDLLMTAGRISVTVYTHKILEEKVTQELPTFREKRSSQRVRHQSSHSPATPTFAHTPTTPTLAHTPTPGTRTVAPPVMMSPCRDNLEQKLKSIPFNRYGSTSSYLSGEASEDEENSDANEEPFTEFNFMKQTSVESNQSLKKTLETGSACVLPFVYVYMTQPHCLVSSGGQKHHKFEMACYDLLVKGASDSHLSPVEDTHQIPDCADFNVHWLETRAGLPHPHTGIPPSLMTVRVVKGVSSQIPDTASLRLERPLRLKVSQLAIEQTVAFAMELSAILGVGSHTPNTCGADTTESASSEGRGRKPNLDDGETPSGLGILSLVDRLELSTSQLVAVMETGGGGGEPDSLPAVGVVASLEGFSMDVDVDRTGNDKCPSFVGQAQVKDALVKLNYEKKSSPLIGPLVLNVETSLTWVPASSGHDLPQLVVMLETGVVMIKLGQEHVFCLTQLLARMACLYQSLLDKTGTPTPTNDGPPPKPSKNVDHVDPTHSKKDFIQEHSYDDLRRGGFEYLEEPEGVILEPEPNQIVFSSHNISGNHDNSSHISTSDGDGYMSWRYPHPRVITNVQLTPVPFGIATDTSNTNNTSSSDDHSTGQTKVQCLLQYYDDARGDFQTCAQFQLLESEPVTVQMQEVKPHNASQLVVASTWKVVLLQSSAEGYTIGKNPSEKRRRDAAVLPVSLAACMCVDSAFVPSLIPTVKARVAIPMVDVRLCHHLDYNGTDVPSKLKRFHARSELVGEQEFAVVRFDDVCASICHVMGSDPRSTVKLSMTNSIDILDYTCLALKKVLEPVRVAADASLITCGQSQEMEVKIELDTVCIRVGKNVVHTLNMAVAAWSNFNPGCSGLLVIFNHFVVCNDTSSVIRFGQSGTDENISLGSREMYAYSWRSFNMAQLLHLCLDQPSWRWTDPFPITQPGVWVREVKAKDQDYAVIVKVTKLSAVQLQVTITGQLLVSNQLSLPISVRLGVADNDAMSSTGGPHPPSPRHQYTLQPGSCLPSMASSQLMACPIQVRLAGVPAPWSHEISLSGDSMKDTHMVKIHLPGDSASYFHIWCRIFCQHFQGRSQKLVMLSPLYVVRTHLPQPLFICLDSPKVKENQELLVKSQGRDFQLHLQGGDVTHSMAFRLGPGMPMSNPPVILSTGLIGQLERRGGGSGGGGDSPSGNNNNNVPDIEQLCNLHLDTGHMTWPYLEMDNGPDKNNGGGMSGLSQSNDQTHLQKSSFPTDLQLEPSSYDPSQLSDLANQQQPSIDLSVQLCEYIPGCETLLVNVCPACLVTNVTDLSIVIAEVVGGDGRGGRGGGDGGNDEDKGEVERRERKGGDGGGMETMVVDEEEGVVGRRWILNPGQTLSPPLPKDQFSVAVMDRGQMTTTKYIPLSDKPMDYKRYNEDIGKVLFVDGYVQAAFVFESSDKDTTQEVVFLTMTSDVQNGIRTICIRDSFCISNQHPTTLTTKLLAVPKKCPRGSTSMAHTDAVTLTLGGKGQQGNEVTPIPRWSVLRAQGGILEGLALPQDSLVFYVAFGIGKEEDDDGTPTSWSLPIRIPTHTKESIRSTTSLPHIHQLSPSPTSSSSSSSPSSSSSTNTDNNSIPSTPSSSSSDILTTHALCVTTHYTRGVFSLVAMEDTAPVLVIENLCPFGIQFGQSCDQLRADEVTIQEQLELVNDLPSVSPGGWCHYTPPAINSQFGSIETVTIPRIAFREASQPSQWSSPIQVSGPDAFVRLQDVCDLKIMIEVVGMVNHLVVRPVSKAEITAKEIRTRLKDGEMQKRETTKPVETKDRAGSTSEGETNKVKPMDVFEKFSEREAIREKYLKKNVINITVGVLSRSVTLFLQDETYPSDVQDILAFHLRDLFFASFPISKNPSVIVSKNCLAASVGNAQLDNQLCGTGAYDFPVVFIPQKQFNSNSDDSIGKGTVSEWNNDSWLLAKTSVVESVALLRSKAMVHAQVVTLSDAIWGQFVIDVIDLSTQPCSLYIDDSFVYRIIEEFELFSPSKLSVPSKTLSSRSSKAYSKLPNKILLSACELSQPLRIRSLTIHQIQVLLSIHASLKLFLASDHTPLNLGKFERQAVYSRPQRLIHSMTMHYASAAIFRAGIVVGSLEILGNPTGLVRSISAGVSDLISMPYSGLTRGPGAFVGGVTRGLGSFVRNVSAGMITSMTNFASSMSRNMDRLSLDENHLERQEVNRRNRPNGISQGVVQGLTGFGLSLLGAVAGLADQPLRSLVQSDGSSDQRAMSATSTASGIVTGMGKGLVGVLTKPIGGAAELVSQTGQGILQGTGLGQMPTRLLPPPPSSSSSQPTNRQKQAETAPVIWSSGFKYAVKVLTSLPSPILYSFPAVTFDILGNEVSVVLVLTSDLLVVINVEEDAQQQTLSLSELHCRCHGDDDHMEEEEEDASSAAVSRRFRSKEKGGDDLDDKPGEDENDAVDANGGRPLERMGSLTLVWMDHYYTSSSLEQQHDASKKRIAAFIDATQKLTTGSHNHHHNHHHNQDIINTPPPPPSPLPLSLLPVKELPGEQQQQHQRPPSSHQSGQPQSLSDDIMERNNINDTTPTTTPRGQGQTTASSTSTSTTNPINDAAPRYRFRMNVHWMRVFVSVFETAKNRLQGRGFSV